MQTLLIQFLSDHIIQVYAELFDDKRKSYLDLKNIKLIDLYDCFNY
jgi:hypothetical protein